MHLKNIQNCIYTWTVVTLSIVLVTFAHDASVHLNQGLVVGLKIFPESSRVPVFSYLGIPYAQPPIGNLRFAPPKPHSGWNRTLYARNIQAVCPQIDANIYEETINGYQFQSKMNEDCLFLNIWTSETALRYGKAAVLAIITGEEMAFDWFRNRPTGLDLASDGIVVVIIQSRTNIFGWLTVSDENAPGNLGLLDQHLALKWCQENIQKFGGDPEKVTLLGHGTSGATNAMIHLTSNKPKYFSKLIVMSGSVFSSYSFQTDIKWSKDPSVALIKKLACDSTNPKFTLECLQQKSVYDLLKAFEFIYQNGNYSVVLGPQIEKYLPKNSRFIAEDPRLLIRLKQYQTMPIMIGICSKEGAFMQDQWLDMARSGYKTLENYIQNTVVPNVLDHNDFEGIGSDQIRDALNWRFFDSIPKTIPHLLNNLQTLLSEVKFENPFFETIELLSREKQEEKALQRIASELNVTPAIEVEHRMENAEMPTENNQISPSVYVYSFQQFNAMDLRGKINYFGGASHSSDLLFLMGPSLFQQIGRRKLSISEDKLCKKMHQYFTDFVKTGNPTPGRLFDAWRPYSSQQKYIHVFGSGGLTEQDAASETVFEKNLNKIEDMLNAESEATVVSNNIGFNPYTIGSANQPSDNSRGAKSYVPEVTNSEYYLTIGKVYSFWNVLLPKIYSNYMQLQSNSLNSTLLKTSMSDRGNSSNFKHAFFSMLSLVCVLLAILGVCVYILKKNNRSISTSYL